MYHSIEFVFEPLGDEGSVTLGTFLSLVGLSFLLCQMGIMLLFSCATQMYRTRALCLPRQDGEHRNVSDMVPVPIFGGRKGTWGTLQ